MLGLRAIAEDAIAGTGVAPVVVVLTGVSAQALVGLFPNLGTRGFISFTKLTMPVPATLVISLTGVAAGTAAGVLTGNASRQAFISFAKLTLPSSPVALLVGQSATFSVGALAPFAGQTGAPVGQHAAAAVGTMTYTATLTLLGQQVQGFTGALIAGDYNALLVGMPGVVISIPLTGQSVACAAGNLTSIGGIANVTLTGLPVGAQVGALGVPQSSNVTLTGVVVGTALGVLGAATSGGTVRATLSGMAASFVTGVVAPVVPVMLVADRNYLSYAATRTLLSYAPIQ